jgi:hypothetical protein
VGVFIFNLQRSHGSPPPRSAPTINPITLNAGNGSCGSIDRLLLGSATTDATKMKSFPCYFLPCCPVTPKSAPCYFFRGISLETLMESAFVDDIAGIFDPFLRFSPVFCPVIFPRVVETGSDPTASSASQFGLCASNKRMSLA